MFRFPASLSAKMAVVACAAVLAACSPKFDWREVRGTSAPFVVLLPAKPATHTRSVNLDGISVDMTMTAADAGGVTFAVGTAELPDAAQAQHALTAMKTALVRNIGGTVRKETAPAAGTLEVEAAGTDSRLLLARFIARDKRIYQVIAVGKESALPPEAAETFFTSFKLN